MIEMLKKRRDSEEGFTLIELMVVVLIIGILLAIAVPTFLKAQENAKSKAATSNLRSGLSGAKTFHAEKESYFTTSAASTLAGMQQVEPGLQWQTTASDQPEEIAFVSTASAILLSNKSKNSYCYYVVDQTDSTATNPAPGTSYGKSTATVSGECTLPAAPTTTITGVTFAKSTQAAGW